MTNREILSYIDYTQLKAFATWKDIEKLCKEAIEFKTASVCIPPSYVKRVKECFLNQLKICTVIGFPLGYQTTAVKLFEAKEAIRDGADEIDMVINIGWVKDGLFSQVTEEIRKLKELAGDKCLKVIIETCYLSTEEKQKLCQCVTDAGADFIKTSTGFGTAGASMEDVLLFRQHIGEGVKIKAAGGIKTREAMENYIEAGCTRIGASSVSELVKV